MRRIFLLIIFNAIFDISIAKNRYEFYHDYSITLNKSNDPIQYIYNRRNSKGELTFFLTQSLSNKEFKILTLDSVQSDLLNKIYFRKNGNILAIFNDHKYGQILYMLNQDKSVELIAPERNLVDEISFSSDDGLSINYRRERSFPDISFSPSGETIAFCQDDSILSTGSTSSN